ncbi:MAG: flavodoxin [Treponema sp.]|jgi:flavodoxin short chain|nr:flavodoxin [Treponema sp.]
MKKVAIIFWSGTGNTELMAQQVAKGVSDAGGTAILKPVGEASSAMVKDADAVAFGSPAMGAEVIEEEEMEPFITGLSSAELGGKPLGLFGSYDWGDGQWMRDWVSRMSASALGAKIDGQGLIVNLTPDEAALTQCRDLGKRLAS